MQNQKGLQVPTRVSALISRENRSALRVLSAFSGRSIASILSDSIEAHVVAKLNSVDPNWRERVQTN
jgi:hypothetical protein